MHVDSDHANGPARKVEGIGNISALPIDQHAPAFAYHPKRCRAIVAGRFALRSHRRQSCQDKENKRSGSQQLPPEQENIDNIMSSGSEFVLPIFRFPLTANMALWNNPATPGGVPCRVRQDCCLWPW